MTSRSSGLILDMRPGDSLSLDGERIRVELLQKSGQLARLRVIAPDEVRIEKHAALATRSVPSLA